MVPRHLLLRRILLAAGIVLACGIDPVGAQEPKTGTGVYLAGRSDKEPPLYQWSLVDAKTKKAMASVSGRWGFEAVPPGDYELRVQKYDALVPYGKVQVTKDKITRVEVKSGVELVGRSDKEPPLHRWQLYDPKTQKPVTFVNGSWGFTPVLPGEYELRVHKYDVEVPFGTVQVMKDKATLVEIKSGVELFGRFEKEPPLHRWQLYDPKTQKPVTFVNGSWGFTPVLPGDYELRVHKYDVEVPYGTVQVTKDKVTRVEVKSGVELLGRSHKEPPLFRWQLFDPKTQKPVTYVDGSWGFTPVLPGDYELRVHKYDVEVPYGMVRVTKDKVTRVEVKSGVELVGRTPKEPPFERWQLLDPKTKDIVTYVSGAWGFTPVRPGQYLLAVQPADCEPFTWATVTVAAEKTTTINVNSGLELSGRTAQEKPPANWYVYDIHTKGAARKPLANITNRWGIATLPPGEYGVTDGLGAYPWAKVKVREGEITRIRVPETAERLAGVTGVGKKTEKQRDPVGFKKLEVEIGRAIRRGAAWLKRQSPLNNDPLSLDGEYETIGVLALLHAGEFERDPALAERCLDLLLRRRLNTGNGTYANSLAVMALADWDPHAYAGRVFEYAQWLVENQGWHERRKVWGYGDAVPGLGEEKKEKQPPGNLVAPEKGFEVIRRGLIKEFGNKDYWDNSCSQFAVLGLHAAAHAGIKLPRKSWELIEQHFRKEQNADGGWGYSEGSGSYGSMSCSGLASLVLARHHLGQKTPDPAVVRALEYLAGYFTLERNPQTTGHHYYYLYGLERAGVLAGTEFLGDHEWYPEGARYLLAKQNADGSWKSETGDGDYLDTCYAILFLRRATLPPVPPKPGRIEVVYKQPKLPPAIVPNIELVLDCSGSMDDKIKGNETRMAAARRVMDKLITDIPDHFNVGFRVFGHQGFWDWRRLKQAPDDHPGWYTDTELLVPIGPLAQGRPAMRKWINYMEPAGATPLCYALLQARKDFHDSMKGPKTVILISDGLENCKGRMEDVEKAYRGSGIDVVIHVVGFAIQEKEHKVLELLAKWTKGNYYRADDASQLAKALKDAMGSLNFIVQNDDGRVVAQGSLKGPGVTLKAGSYRVSIQGIREAPLQVRVESEQTLRLTLDPAGRLMIADRK